MSECKCDCVILKRVCTFFLGVVIGLTIGYKFGLTEAEQNHHDDFIEEAEKPVLLEKRERRKKLREHLERTETPKVRVPR
jgi:hypothetical protein